MPGWWRDLVTIPNAGDPERLACKIHASFEVPQVRCKALKDPGDYTVPPPQNVSRGKCSSQLSTPTCLAKITS